MAVEEKKIHAEILKMLIDSYASAVRAGVITPCLQDENDFRKMLGLQVAPAEVEASWVDSNGVRSPVTLQKGLPTAASAQPQPQTEEVPDNAS